MLIRRLYIAFIVSGLIFYSLDAQTFGFKPDGSNYYKSVSEATDGTIQILVEDDDGVAGFSINFQLHIDYTTNVSTSNYGKIMVLGTVIGEIGTLMGCHGHLQILLLIQLLAATLILLGTVVVDIIKSLFFHPPLEI